MLPQTPSTYITERNGINAVATAISHLGFIWRETPTGDVGVDGQIEHVDTAGRATGRLLSVQVKSGKSYFSLEDDGSWLFYPEDRHRAYWEQHPLPVILVLHNPDTRQSYWTDIRQQLRGERTGRALSISKANILQNALPNQLFETVGVDGSTFIESLSDVLMRLCQTKSMNASFPLSHFDLFAHGLTNISRSIYYGMDLANIIAEYKLSETDFGIGVGGTEHNFMFEFVKFLVAQNLARVDFADCLVSWNDREMQPHFVAPLTSRGRSLVALIHQIEERAVNLGVLSDSGVIHVAQEAFFSINFVSLVSRLSRIQEFQRILASAGVGLNT